MTRGKAFWAACALTLVVTAAPAIAGMDLALTQRGASAGFGGRDEFTLTGVDKLLLRTNNVVTHAPPTIVDAHYKQRRPAKPRNVGEVVGGGKTWRLVYDRMVWEAVAQTLWLDSGSMSLGGVVPQRQVEPVYPLASGYDSFSGESSGFRGGSGGGGGDSGFDPPFLFPPVMIIPEPGVSLLLTFGLVAICSRRRIGG